MSQFASPASGCHLQMLEVQVGDEVETYNATTFDQPLEFSLQGQRSLTSELGTLLLVISTGSKQMLSLRLNDLLNHPYGTEETIAIDKQAQKVCVRLPNLDHTLRIWFQHSRDFSVSVCILRKAGFTIEEGPCSPLAKTGRRRMNKNVKPKQAIKPVDSSIHAPLAALPEQVRNPWAPRSPPREDALVSSGNIFDEVLDLLNDVAANRNSTTDRPTIESCLRGPGSRENLKNQSPRKDSDDNFPGAKTGPPPARRHHGYFTRSFSAAAGRVGTRLNEPQHSQWARKHGAGKRSAQNASMESPQGKVRTSFEAMPTVDFRNLMPRRRSLPFLVTKHHSHKRIKKKEGADPDCPRTSLHTSTMTAMQTLSAQPICSILEIPMVLMDVSTLDELETRSSFLYRQYEQDITHRRHDAKRAAFYFDWLESIRRRFWLEKLRKVSGLYHEAQAG
ncbi:hypothetical protein E4U42_007846 [Claviceps africana]|uniref:Uncharacterized protein n=1 Tax=Claviceps africana TaxID=83212 RepID=A0A8K0NIN1_9HYPO|nr:hypothetical protein E4U42_007846 [Claviceps africana]